MRNFVSETISKNIRIGNIEIKKGITMETATIACSSFTSLQTKTQTLRFSYNICYVTYVCFRRAAHTYFTVDGELILQHLKFGQQAVLVNEGVPA